MTYLEQVLYSVGANPNNYDCIEKLAYNKIPMYQLLAAKFLIEMDFLSIKPTQEMYNVKELIFSMLEEAREVCSEKYCG